MSDIYVDESSKKKRKRVVQVFSKKGENNGIQEDNKGEEEAIKKSTSNKPEYKGKRTEFFHSINPEALKVREKLKKKKLEETKKPSVTIIAERHSRGLTKEQIQKSQKEHIRKLEGTRVSKNAFHFQTRLIKFKKEISGK